MKCLFPIADIEMEMFSFQPINSKMYILLLKQQAIVIDPCISPEALYFLENRNCQEISIILTHEHYDHISGVNWLKSHFNCNVICTEKCSVLLPNRKKNLSLHFDALFSMHSEQVKMQIQDLHIEPYSCEANQTFCDKMTLDFGPCQIELIETPGHSRGSLCILVDNKCIFTGDNLVNGTATVTKLPGGSKSDYETITLPLFLSLPEWIIVFPGHGDPVALKELIDRERINHAARR